MFDLVILLAHRAVGKTWRWECPLCSNCTIFPDMLAEYVEEAASNHLIFDHKVDPSRIKTTIEGLTSSDVWPELRYGKFRNIDGFTQNLWVFVPDAQFPARLYMLESEVEWYANAAGLKDHVLFIYEGELP